MTDKKKIQKLKKCFDDVVWMAVRYAHGRMTYAPHNVRDAIKSFKEVFPEWKLRKDDTLFVPESETSDGRIKGDYLNDLFE